MPHNTSTTKKILAYAGLISLIASIASLFIMLYLKIKGALLVTFIGLILAQVLGYNSWEEKVGRNSAMLGFLLLVLLTLGVILFYRLWVEPSGPPP